MAGGVACVLFTDLVGSTELMSRLGDARFDAVRSEHFTGLREALTGAGGTEVKTTGDGLLATFTSAVDALTGAVAAQQATDRHARRAEVPLSIRVGLALGEVAWEGGDVFGTPVVEAARLVAAARPGQILCTALLRAVAGSRAGAGVSDAGSLELKGLPDPVAVCEVAWEPLATAGARPPLPPLLAGAGRIFVGRDAELERALRLWKEVAGDGGRQLVLLAGEPGIGKTRLAIELARRVHAEGAVVLAGRCDEDLGVPYQPFVEALRHYVRHVHGQRRLGRHAEELVRLVPELAELVAGLPEPLRSDPETERYRLFDAVAAWLADASIEAPVLLVLDDLHWAAKPTVLLLRHVLRASEPARLLVTVTYRDTDIGRGDPLTGFLADLRREGGVERLGLGGLDRAGVGAFVEAAAGHSLADENGELFVRAVWEETEGNPFFVAEVIRHLTESGALEQRDGRWVTTAAVEDLGIPEGVRDVVGRRLSRLPEETEQVLAVASVVGLEFEPGVVVAAGGRGEDAVFAALEEAVAARLLSEVPGAARYRFAHALVRATLYDEISGPRRVVLHRRVAQAIETVHGGDVDDHLPALAHHWARASAPAADADRAVDYATRAGGRALAQLANDEASAYYTQALELLDAAGGASDDGRRQELLISLGEAQRRAGDPAHRETLLVAARLAQQRGDAAALSRAALANSRGIFSSAGAVDTERASVLEAALEAVGQSDTASRARLLAALAVELVFGPDSERRFALSDEALVTARRLGDPIVLATVLVGRFTTIWSPDTLAERLANTAELRSLADESADPVLDFWASRLGHLAAMQAGDIAEADRCLGACCRRADELGQPVLLWIATYTRATRVLMDGLVDEARQLASEAAALARVAGQPDADVFFVLQDFGLTLERGDAEELEAITPVMADLAGRIPLTTCQAALAVLYLETGRRAEATAVFEHCRDRGFDRIPKDNSWVSAVVLLARVCTGLHSPTTAPVLYRLLAPYSDQIASHSILWFGAISHSLGLLATVLRRFSQAEEHFGAAAATHERINAPAWLARTRLEWGAVLLRRAAPGDTERALELLDQALATAAELGLGAVERRVRQLLAEAGR